MIRICQRDEIKWKELMSLKGKMVSFTTLHLDFFFRSLAAFENDFIFVLCVNWRHVCKLFSPVSQLYFQMNLLASHVNFCKYTLHMLLLRSAYYCMKHSYSKERLDLKNLFILIINLIKRLILNANNTSVIKLATSFIFILSYFNTLDVLQKFVEWLAICLIYIRLKRIFDRC